MKVVIIGFTVNEAALALSYTMSISGVFDVVFIDPSTTIDITQEAFVLEEIKCISASKHDHGFDFESDYTRDGIKALSIKHGNIKRNRQSFTRGSDKERHRLNKGLRGSKFGRKGRI